VETFTGEPAAIPQLESLIRERSVQPYFTNSATDFAPSDAKNDEKANSTRHVLHVNRRDSGAWRIGRYKIQARYTNSAIGTRTG
jgi:hypothetical protein